MRYFYCFAIGFRMPESLFLYSVYVTWIQKWKKKSEREPLGNGLKQTNINDPQENKYMITYINNLCAYQRFQSKFFNFSGRQLLPWLSPALCTVKMTALCCCFMQGDEPFCLAVCGWLCYILSVSFTANGNRAEYRFLQPVDISYSRRCVRVSAREHISHISRTVGARALARSSVRKGDFVLVPERTQPWTFPVPI